VTVSQGVAVASGARTASGASAARAVSGLSTVGQIGLAVNVTAVSGTTPSMSLAVEWSSDGTTFGPADVADTFAAAFTAASLRAKAFTAKAPFYRLVWTITGTTPSFTFDVTEVQY